MKLLPNKRSLGLLLLALSFFFIFPCMGSYSAHGDEPMLYVGHFSSMAAGNQFSDGWEPLYFKKIQSHTRYQLVNAENGIVVVKAESLGSASGMTKKITIDPVKYPILNWRWKVLNQIRGSDPRTKTGSDYPARLYITFHFDPANASFFEKLRHKTASLFYGQKTPLAAITYVWASDTLEDTYYSSPYTDKVKIIVLQKGSKNIGRWVTQERNIVEDFKMVFGDIPPAISAIAIMSDTDNTGTSATAFYGDIVFKKK